MLHRHTVGESTQARKFFTFVTDRHCEDYASLDCTWLKFIYVILLLFVASCQKLITIAFIVCVREEIGCRMSSCGMEQLCLSSAVAR